MEQIDKLALALIAAQSRMKPAVKSAVNPFHKSRYADLESVWESVSQVLAEHGLGISQTFRCDGELPILVTRLIHTSGQQLISEIPVIAAKKDPQGYGSAITYFRRYALQAILSLVTTDDDGEGASERVQHSSNDYQLVKGPFKGRTLGSLTTDELRSLIDSVDHHCREQKTALVNLPQDTQETYWKVRAEITKRQGNDK